MYIILAVVILLIVVVLIVQSVNGKAQSQLGPYINAVVPQSVINQLNVPVSVSSKIGIGGVQYFPQKINAQHLTLNGKPLILYIGAEYCPYCAVTRWGMIIALMKFGTFSGLKYMASNESDVYPNTPTFTFYNSTYTSNYISFQSVETTTRNHAVPLQVPTPFQNALVDKYDPSGGIPFIDFANASVQVAAPVLPSALQGQNWNSTIANLTNSSSAVSQNLVGSADVFTAQICMLTNNTPASVCSQAYVINIERNNLR